MKKNIVVFGGSFDPIHKGHITLVKQMFNNITDIEQLYIIPTGDHPESKKHLFSDQERLFMLKSCFGLLKDGDFNNFPQLSKEQQFIPEFTHPNIIISDLEINKNNKSYTIDTINHIKNIHPQVNIHLLVGSDQASNFSQWHQVQDLIQMVTLWTYPRKGFKLDPNYQWNIINFEEQNISSSMIREMLYKNDSLNHEFIPNSISILALLFFIFNKND